MRACGKLRAASKASDRPTGPAPITAISSAAALHRVHRLQPFQQLDRRHRAGAQGDDAPAVVAFHDQRELRRSGEYTDSRSPLSKYRCGCTASRAPYTWRALRTSSPTRTPLMLG